MTEKSLHDPALALAADTVDDIEDVRKATANRLRILTTDQPDEDGVMRGFGYPETHPAVSSLAAFLELIESAEKMAVGNLEKLLRKHPLYKWSKQHRGIGDKQIGRLLGVIGDPYIRPDWTRADGTVVPKGPRTVSALWAYMGLHVVPGGQASSDDQPTPTTGDPGGDPDQGPPGTQIVGIGVAPRRKRGEQSNWNDTARMRIWNVAKSVVKSGIDTTTCVGATKSETGEAIHEKGCGCSIYRLEYDAARLKYAEAVHDVSCVRCGPKGKPAQPGSDLSAGHKEARALRAVMKKVAQDLWIAARAYHESE